MTLRISVALVAFSSVLDITCVLGGVVIRKPKEVTSSMQAADAINDYRKAEEKKAAAIKYAANSPKGARVKSMKDVLKAQGSAVAAAEKAKRQTEEMMDDVAISGDLPTKEPPKIDKDIEQQAADLADKMGSGALGCECAAQLYGDASTTKDTKVSLMSKKGHIGHSQKIHSHHKNKATNQRVHKSTKLPFVSTYDLDEDCDCDDE